jgi:hypothetical protein
MYGIDPSRPTPDDVLECAKRIRLVTDEIDDNDAIVLDAQAKIAAADQVVFLGFAYDPRNLERLGTAGLTSGAKGYRRLQGTCHGLTAGNIDRVQKTLQGIALADQLAHKFVEELPLLHGVHP